MTIGLYESYGFSTTGRLFLQFGNHVINYSQFNRYPPVECDTLGNIAELNAVTICLQCLHQMTPEM